MSGKNLIVVGGGAAGFFCAVNAARMAPHLKVTLLEKTGKLLSKVKVSGGGRCNVTHALFDVGEMSRRYPRGANFVKKAFHQFFTSDTVQWFEERGVKLKAEGDGRMFPVTDSSQTIIDCLMAEANRYGVEIRLQAEVQELTVEEGTFRLSISGNRTLMADFICIACGGFPKAAQFAWLQQLGHSISAPVPSLFTFNLPKHPVTGLMGVSVPEAKVKIEGTKLVEQGPVLITHWGLSGPAVLRLSAWGARELLEKDYRFTVHLNWLPEQNDGTMKAAFLDLRATSPARKVTAHNITSLPNRLWQFLAEQSGVDEGMRWADLPAKAANALVRNLVDYTLEVSGKTTFKEEFVTAGGIQLGEIDPNTMMSKKVPRLYFSGEIMDVDGITGGFNFQHAWTSGWIAAKSVAGQ